MVINDISLLNGASRDCTANFLPLSPRFAQGLPGGENYKDVLLAKHRIKSSGFARILNINESIHGNRNH